MPLHLAQPAGRSTSLAVRIGLLAMLAAGASTLGGCYERVVGARGLGADQYRVSEPYQENSKLDDWVFGEQKRDTRTPRP